MSARHAEPFFNPPLIVSRAAWTTLGPESGTRSVSGWAVNKKAQRFPDGSWRDETETVSKDEGFCLWRKQAGVQTVVLLFLLPLLFLELLFLRWHPSFRRRVPQVTTAGARVQQVLTLFYFILFYFILFLIYCCFSYCCFMFSAPMTPRQFPVCANIPGK